MRLSKPAPNLSDNDKKLLAALSVFLLQEHGIEGGPTNAAASEVVLTDVEAAELLKLLDIVVNDKRFFAKTALVHSISSGRDKESYKLFLELKYGPGQKHPWVRQHWRVVAKKFGTFFGYTDGAMDFDDFIKFEKKLFNHLEVHPRISALLISYIERRKSAFEALRRQEAPWRKSFNRDVFNPIRQALGVAIDCGGGLIPRRRLASLFTIVANTSVLVTSANWDAAAYISTVGGVYVSSISVDD